jgi:hypothetical protein
MNKYINNFLKLALFVYLFFLATGPVPVHVGPVKIDILSAVLILIFSLPYYSEIFKKIPFVYLIIIAAFFFIGLLSTLLSEDFNRSIVYLGIIGGYALVMLVVPVALGNNQNVMRWLYLTGALCATSIVFFLILKWGFGETARFAMSFNPEISRHSEGAVDPNMTAFGLNMAIIFSLPLLKNKKVWFKILLSCSYVAIFIASLATVSRTAFVATLFSLTMATIIWSMKMFHKRAKHFFIIFLSLIFLLGIGFLIAYKFVPQIITKAIHRTEIHQNSDAVDRRQNLIIINIKKALETVKGTIIGIGFHKANPHNEFVRNFTNSGFLGLFAFISIFIAAYWYLIRPISSKNSLEYISSRALFMYLLIIIQTYGHTKSLWCGLMFLCALYIEEQNRVNEIVVYEKKMVHYKFNSIT